MTATVLQDVLERSQREERQRALRALLLRPLLGADHNALRLVRRHADWLREWLHRETGWMLRVERDFARLRKFPADHRDGRRAAVTDRRAGGQAFNRRRYCLLCLALAMLERGEGQTALGRLGEQIVDAATDPVLDAAGIRFRMEHRDERRDLVAVVRLLLDLGILVRIAGDEEAFVHESGDALYDVNRRVLAEVLICPRGPSLVETLDGDPGGTDGRLAAVYRGLEPHTDDARNRALRHGLTRRLLDDPVVYYDDLTEAEHAYLNSQRAALVQRVREAAGLVDEVRAEGLAMVDPAGELSDRRLPSEGTEGHATLLLAAWLAERGAAGATPISREDAVERMRAWIAQYGNHWKKAAREPGAEQWLLAEALERLYALHLAEPVQGKGIRPLPAVARYGLAEAEMPAQTLLHAER